MAPRSSHRAAAPERARRAQRALAALALLAVAVGTVAGHARASDDADRAAERVSEALAAESVASVETVVGRALSALQGVGALVDEQGAVDEADFDAFGAGVVGGPVTAVVLGVEVPDDERARFEAVNGPILRRRPGGTLALAPDAPEYFPVVRLAGDDPNLSRLDGYDYGGEPVRAATVRQARDEGRTVLSEPTLLQTRGQPGFLVVRPLYRRGVPVDTVAQRRDAFVGFVSIGYAAADVLAALERELRPGTAVSVRDGALELFGTGSVDGELSRSATVNVPGRTWTVTVRPADGADRALPRAILVGGALVGVGLVLLFAVTGRYQARLRRAYGAQRQAQRRSETLEGLASRLSQSLSSAEVAEVLLAHLQPFVGTAAGAVLAPHEEDGTYLRVLASEGYAPDRLTPVRRVHAVGTSALADAVRTAEPVWAPSPLAWRDDPVLAAFGDVGQAAAVIPLVADDLVVGLLVLVHAGVRRFYEDERSLLDTVAPLAARALVRARRYDTEHDAAVVLQKALLPPRVPALAEVTVAVRYLPATGALAVGGDFYDAFPIGDGRIGLVVGDVVGRGVRAAAAMGQLRSALRAFASVIPEPSALLRAFEAHVPTIPDALCATMIYAVLDPAAGHLTYVRAGHPPPLRLRPGAEAEFLHGRISPPLGVTGGPPIVAAGIAMEPGDTLVLYTDGVVERRGEPVTAGLERLRVAGTEAASLDPEACCDRIVEALLGDQSHGDDAAVVAIRLEPAPSSSTSGAGAPEASGRLAPFA